MEPILNVVLPVFAIIAAGYACGRTGLLGRESSEALNRFVYWVALPVLLFRAMATVDMAAVFDLPFLAAVIGAQLLVWAAAGLLAWRVFGLKPAEAGLHGLNGVYANTGYMGIPLVIAAFGQEMALPAIITAVINAGPIIAVALVAIEIAQNRGAGGLLKDVARALATNPMLVAPVAGLLWATSGWALPTPVDTFTGILGAAAGPCALFAIGLFLVGLPLRAGLGEVGWVTAIKLVVHPAVTAALALWVFAVDPMWAVVAVLMAALPTGAGCFVLAQAYGLYVQRTSAVIFVSTVLSVLTLSLLFAILPPAHP